MNEQHLIMKASDYFYNFHTIRFFAHMSLLYNRKLAIKSGFYEIDVLSADIYSILKLCINNPAAKIIMNKNISGVWVQHHSNASRRLKPAAHLKNIGIYKKLVDHSIQSGFDKDKCFKWLNKARNMYFRFYVGMMYKKLK